MAREPRNELGIPLRWGMKLLGVARAIKDATDDEKSETGLRSRHTNYEKRTDRLILVSLS